VEHDLNALVGQEHRAQTGRVADHIQATSESLKASQLHRWLWKQLKKLRKVRTPCAHTQPKPGRAIDSHKDTRGLLSTEEEEKSRREKGREVRRDEKNRKKDRSEKAKAKNTRAKKRKKYIYLLRSRLLLDHLDRNTNSTHAEDPLCDD
jgi:hypothetical protein